MAVLTIIVALCVFIWFQVSSKKKRTLRKRNNMELMLGAGRNFQPAFVETFCDNEYGLGIDTENKRLAVVVGENRRILNFEQIIEVETLVNGRSVSGGGVKTWKGTSDAVLGGIVASGNVAGGVAALVAAHNNKIQCLSLRILTDELVEPWAEVQVFNVKERKAVGDPAVQKAMRQCEDWGGRLRSLIVSSHKAKNAA